MSQFSRILIVPLLAAVCIAQGKQPDADRRATAERLAATLDLPQFHGDAAKGFAGLGPVALPVLERVLRKGTDVEALGALVAVVTIKGEDASILGLLEWLLAHRAEVVEMKPPRMGGGRGMPRGAIALFGYLRQRIGNTPKALDLLWSLVGGPLHTFAASALGRAKADKARLMAHVVRDLDSKDKTSRERAVAFLTWMPRYRRWAPPDVVTAIEKVLGAKKPDLTEIKKLAKSKDRMTKRAARTFRSTFRALQRARRARKPAVRAAPPKRKPMQMRERLAGMLDLPTLRDRAIAELAKIGAPAVPALQRALAHESHRVVEGAVRGLARIKPPTPEVNRLLTDVLVDKKRTAAARITIMGFFGQQMEENRAAFELIRDRIDKSESVAVRIAAIRELAQTEKHRHDAINALELVLRSEPVEVVEYATSALGIMGTTKDDRILMLILRQLQSTDNKIRRAAIYALAGKGANVHLERFRKRKDLDAGMKAIIDQVLRVKSGVLAGFVIADYSDNRILHIDVKGKELNSIEEIFGVWDVEVLDGGNYLITEFSVNRVREVTPAGKEVWSFARLKNPYDADRLPNGNTLIADTFGRRVIEVDKAGRIVWKFDKDIHPYDVDRLRNGNTLIADTHDNRVIEVNPAGRIVWQVKNVPNVHDADRLPNGNTLLTIRMLNEVREVDREGRTVFTLRHLSSPSDADRLPDGRTVVAENGFVRFFDARGVEVKRHKTTWAVEVNPVWKYPEPPEKKAP